MNHYDIVSTHDGGFFSCCSVKLHYIVHFINLKKNIPTIDSSSQFSMYKFKNGDITYDYFEHYNSIENIIKYPIHYKEYYQFTDYSQLNYSTIIPIITKYFTPSKKIMNTVDYLKNKYCLDNLDEYIGVYYRATDKVIETQIASFYNFYEKIIEIKNNENKENLKVIIQTDSSHFLDYIKTKLDKDIIVIEENDRTYSDTGLHFVNDSIKNYKDMFYLFSTFLILCKCKYMITGSSNASMWMMFYRGNNNNVHQYLNGQWLNNPINNDNDGLYIVESHVKPHVKPHNFSKFFFNQ